MYIPLRVGSAGDGALNIENGGVVRNTVGYLGDGGNGTVTVDGIGSLWINSAELYVGYESIGTLEITAGGKVSNTDGYIGNRIRAAGSSVTVSGNASTWVSTGDLYVGYGGGSGSSGTLTVEKNGLVQAGFVGVGSSADSTGTINLIGNAPDGRGILETAYVAKGLGSATLNLNGGILRATRDESDFLRGFGMLTAGAEGIWIDTNGHAITVGPGTTFAGWSSFNKIGDGTLTLTGDSSIFEGQAIVDGGTLELAQSGKLGSSFGYIASSTGSVGSVTVTGAGSSWANAGDLYVGALGNGTLTVSDGGRVSNASGYIAFGAGSVGSVTVTGTDGNGNASTWTNNNALAVGYFRSGTLTVGDGGKVTSLEGTIAYGSEGQATVTGAGSSWTNSTFFVVGYDYGGRGTLTVSDGGAVTNSTGYIGFRSSSEGHATVTGAGSSWTSYGNLHVGDRGHGTLRVEDGGRVSDVSGFIAFGSGSEGHATVTGAGSSWTSTGSLHVGYADHGTLTLSEGGTANASSVRLGAPVVGAVNSGTLNIGAAAGDAAVAAGILDTASLEFRNGTGTLNFNHLGATAFDAALISTGSGTHAVNHSAGITTLTGNSSAFTGTTTVSGGTLVVADALGGSASVTGGSFVVDGTFGGDVAVHSGGTLGGHGSILGSVSVGSGGTLSPGNSVGTTTIGGDLNLAAGAISAFELGGPGASSATPGTSDRIDVAGDLAFNGTVNLSQSGDAADGTAGIGYYRLITYGGSLTSNTATIGSTPGSLSGVDYTLQAGSGHVDLFIDASSVLGDDALQHWQGGNGIWNGINTQWLNAGGDTPVAWAGNIAVFKNEPGGFNGGVIDVQGAQSFKGIQFVDDGYTLQGSGQLVTDAAGSEIRVLADSATIATAITGTGGITKTEAGTLILTGANTYTGGTQVAAGTLVGNAGSIRGDIANAGTVEFDQAADASFAGNIAGLGGTNGMMVKSGAGNLALTGTSSLDWTIKAGGLSTDASRFIGNAAIGGGASLTFDQGGNATYAGALSGSGAFAISGSGIVTLTGDSSAFTGMTTIGSGNTLVVGTSAGGKLGGSMTVGSGGLLGGTGMIGSAGTTVTIAAGAVHAPGNSIGVQTFAGNYVNHGTLRVEATPTEADKIVVAGSVDITGATLDLVLSPTDASSWNVFNGPFTIIDKQSAGAVVGSFGPVTQNLLFLDAILDYAGGDGNDVTLALERNDLAFAGVGQTPNQIATGTAIDTLDNTNPIWRSIALSSDADIVRASFDALSGEIHASAKSAMIEDSRFLRNAVNDRIRAAFGSVGASTGPVVAYGDGGPLAAAATTDRFAVWGQGFGSWGKTNGDGNAATLNRSTGGFFIGADAPVFDSWRLGVVTGYSRTSFDVKDRFSSGSSDNYHVGLYGGTTWGALSFRTGTAYTWQDISTSRSVSFPGFGDSLKGDYNAGTAQVFGEVGYRMQAANIAFEPFANLAYVNLHTDGLTEKGGAAALTSGSVNTDATFTTLGLRASTTFDLNGAAVTAKGTLGWRHAFGDVTPDSVMGFAAGGDAFSIAGVPIARDAAVVEAGLDFALSPSAVLGVSYGGQFGSGVTDQTFRASFNVKF